MTKLIVSAFAALLCFLVACTSTARPLELGPRLTKDPCENAVKTAALMKHFGETVSESTYKILHVKNYGRGVRKLGNLKLSLYTVEIADEADGAVMVAFVIPKTCKVHDITFGTMALSR